MEGLSWSASPHPEAFNRQRNTSETLNRLASFIARAESKQGLARSSKPLPQQQQLQGDTTLPFSCHECGEGFLYSAELLKHQEEHHTLPKPHQCSSCGTAFSLRSSLQLHNCEASQQVLQPQVQNSPTYATSLVPDNSIDGLTFRQPHVLDISPYACAPCGKGFALKQALLHHQQAGCVKAASPSCADNPACPTEDFPFASEEDSSTSSLYVPAGESACKVCSSTFIDEAAFRCDHKTQHSDELNTDLWERVNGECRTKASTKSPKGAFSCRSCEMVFSSPAELSEHRKEQHRRGLGMMSADIVEPLILRLRKKTNNTYTCQICSQVFFHHLSLWAHKKKHPTLEFGSSNTNNEVANDKSRLPNEDASKKLIEAKQNMEKKFVPSRIVVRESTLTKANMFGLKLHKPQKFTASFTPLNATEVPEYEDSLDNDDDDEAEFPCPSCPEVFSRHSDLKAHVELHQSSVRRSRCSVCSSEMDSLKWPGSKRLRLYHCILCQTGFSTLEPFLTHCQNHLKTKVEEDGSTSPLNT